MLHMQVYVSDETKRVGRECLGFRARMLSRVTTAAYDDALSEVGLTVGQFGALTAVANREAARPAELAKVLEMDESTASRNVERMCANGWLRLRAATEDRRSHQIAITEKGIALIRRGYPAWQKAQNEIARQLGPDGVTALKSVARKIRA